MLDAFLFVGLPYLAIAVLVVGTVFRFRSQRYGVSSLSSQILESRRLPLGSIPWHAGILVLLLGHLIPFLVPGLWRSLAAIRPFLLAVETVGVAAGVLAAWGMCVLLWRRIASARLQRVTTGADLAVLFLLLGQVLLGLVVATSYRWGALWSTGTTTPYLWSIITLQPELGFVAELPGVMKIHLVGAWVIFLLVPFTRLVHAFAVPVQYFVRAPQRVVWSTRRRLELMASGSHEDPAEGRRHLLKGAGALLAASALLSLGVLDKFVRFLRGGDPTEKQKRTLMAEKLHRLEQTGAERRLELERLEEDTIFVAKIEDLSPKTGRYFIDYQMRPALAFKDDDGLPLLISAKCTHLGCTVASEVDGNGRILCPCHISWFDIRTGRPNDGAPAKEPLPHIGWVVKDDKGRILSSKGPGGAVEGERDVTRMAGGNVFIARRFEGSGGTDRPAITEASADTALRRSGRAAGAVNHGSGLKKEGA